MHPRVFSFIALLLLGGRTLISLTSMVCYPLTDLTLYFDFAQEEKEADRQKEGRQEVTKQEPAVFIIVKDYAWSREATTAGAAAGSDYD